jgi:hypothetical protein
MTAQPRQHRNREPGPANSPRRTSGPPPPEDGIAADTASRAGQDSHGGPLARSVREAARLTGLSCDLLDGQMRLGNLACGKAGRWRLVICQHLPLFPGIVS